MEYGVPGYYKLTGAQGTGSTSFSARIQHYHWEAWDTLDTTGLVNWSPFGTASRVTRKVFPAFTRAEKTYWQQTGMFIPVDLDQPQSGSDSDYFPAILALGGSDKYEPMGRLDVIGGGGTGAASDIGVIGEWASHAFITGRQIDWDHARLISLNMPMHGQATLLDEATGRIPVLNNGPPTGPGGNGNGNGSGGAGNGGHDNPISAGDQVRSPACSLLAVSQAPRLSRYAVEQWEEVPALTICRR